MTRNAVALFRRLSPCAVGCVAIVVAALARGGHRSSAGSTPASILGDAPPWSASLALAEDECESRLEFAHVFERRTRMRATFAGARAPAEARALRRALGLPLASVLLLYDARRVLRIAIELPRTPAAADALVRWLAHPEG